MKTSAFQDRGKKVIFAESHQLKTCIYYLPISYLHSIAVNLHYVVVFRQRPVDWFPFKNLAEPFKNVFTLSH